jgi:mono/diheme cytochrome c family protein
MRRSVPAVLVALVLGLSLLSARAPGPASPAVPSAQGTAGAGSSGAAEQPAASPVTPLTSRSGSAGAQAPADHNGVVRQYCVTCHSDRAKAGGLTLASFELAKATDEVGVAEKMIRKLRAGMMPPAGARRPDAATVDALITALETTVDRAADRVRPGSRVFQRLNRAEYGRAVRDLLALDIDVSGLLPADQLSAGFDNVADSQMFSPTLMEAYLRAASKVTALAVGDPRAESAEALYRVPKTLSQMGPVEGAPLGTRGGLSIVHTFPADGEYTLRLELHSNACGYLFGGPTTGEQMEVSIDGERAALVDVNPRMADMTGGLSLRTPGIHVTAGAHRVTAAFLQRFEGPVNDLFAPIDHTLADTQIGVSYGITTLPHLKDLTIVGPVTVTGVSDTDSRRRIFTCRPTAPAEEKTCASRIVRDLATQAFRRPVSARDFERLMAFYEEGRAEGDFELGVASALEAILASPQFLFRLEPVPATATAGQPYRLDDLALASRLSFFLWGSGPDATLLKAATSGALATPAGLDREVRRMLADPRSDALATRFAGQWLRLADVEQILPDAILYPYFDRSLGRAMVRETELFFDSLVREDRSVLDLLTADHSFVNGRLARHYGIPNITGNAFERVTVPEERRGLLGKGSVLMLTSVADRTSPVMRGKWVMEVLLGSPPPAPPPNVPALEETKAAGATRLLTVRERMEEHRKNPACRSCHRVIDPLGLALENFDVTGKWRIKDNGAPVDPTGELYDGTPMDGPAGLRRAILKHQDVFVLSFTESLLTYALGRRIEAEDMPMVRRIVREASAGGLKISAVAQAIVRSPAFRMGVELPATTDTAVARPD